MTQIETERRNRIRGLIIKILAPDYPNPLDSAIIRRALADFGYPVDEDSLKSYLAYLQERGLVRIEERKFGIHLNFITADGLNLLDGLTEPDPGVDTEGL